MIIIKSTDFKDIENYLNLLISHQTKKNFQIILIIIVIIAFQIQGEEMIFYIIVITIIIKMSYFKLFLVYFKRWIQLNEIIISIVFKKFFIINLKKIFFFFFFYFFNCIYISLLSN